MKSQVNPITNGKWKAKVNPKMLENAHIGKNTVVYANSTRNGNLSNNRVVYCGTIVFLLPKNGLHEY